MFTIPIPSRVKNQEESNRSFCYVNFGYSPDCKYSPKSCPRRAQSISCDCWKAISPTASSTSTSYVNLNKVNLPLPVALEDEHFSMYQQKPRKQQQELPREEASTAAFRRAASFAYDGVQEMSSQLRRSFRSTRSHTITTAWHSVMKRKCEERAHEDEGEYGEDDPLEKVDDKRWKNAGGHVGGGGGHGHHTNVVIYAGVLRTYDMTAAGFSNTNYKS